MVVTFVHADDAVSWNSANWRSLIPAAAFNRSHRHRAHLLSMADFAGLPPIAEYYCADADVIVLQRGAMPPAWGAVEHWRRKGKLVLADIDDGYPQIGPEHPSFAFWHRGISMANGQPVQMSRPAIHDMVDGLRKVNGLTSPSKLILADWKEQARGALVPNYPDLRPYAAARRTRSPNDDGAIWVAWGGSAGHLASFTNSNILYTLARVLARRPHARMVFVGADPRQYDAIPLRAGQKQHFNWQPYADWPYLLANFDIGLVPAAGEFDARRSWIKPMELSLMGVPWIASKSPAYEGLEDYGIFVENTPDGWADALIEALDHCPDTARIKRARKWAQSLDIDDHVDEMVKTYRSFRT